MLTALPGGPAAASTGSTSASTCLEKAGANVKENQVTPTFQSTGVRHALVVTLHPGDRQALLLFAKNGILATQAEQLLAALVGSSRPEQRRLPVRRKGNVLVSWLTASTAADDELLDKCLLARVQSLTRPRQRALELIEEWTPSCARELPAAAPTSSTPTCTSATTSTGSSATTTSSSR